MPRFLGKEGGESEGEEENSLILFVSQSKMSDWRSSTVRKSVLESFVKKGFLLPQEVAH